MRTCPLLLLLAACAPETPPPPEPAPSPWEAALGRELTVEGVARRAKLGPMVETGGGGIWIDGPHGFWPEGVVGRRVKVTGTVVRKDDLPVFIPRPGEPMKAGIPVPEGTDLEEARIRYLLASPRWERLPD